ncbi:FecR family protein [Dyella sp.]|uniref:FecR family protein n=1 Tax=Dyella sp. TaxID=1869338 RepID=UPI002B471D11|nr:FecR domain-containing protein [Dyella sp.]HKT29584.1 FecR domain-containing protein [Dyella sp.]
MNESTHFDAARQARRITEQAVAWYIEQQEPLSERQRVAFLEWLRASPKHIAEYFAVVRLHGDIKAAAALQKLTSEQLVEQARRDNPIVMFPHMEKVMREERPSPPARHRLAKYALATVASAGSIAMAWLGVVHWRAIQIHQPPQAVFAKQYSATQATQSLTLADGTLVQLDRNSSIDVHYDSHVRRIDVQSGHVLFDVGKDPTRPMFVDVGGHVLQDIGTIFDVKRDTNGDTFTVISGRVRVLNAEPSSTQDNKPPLPGLAVADLTAGMQIAFDVSGTGTVRPIAVAEASAWLPTDISFHHETIANVARRFNAYTSTPLEIDDQTIAGKRISGVFHADNPQAFMAYLATLPDVRIIHDADRIRVVAVH